MNTAIHPHVQPHARPHPLRPALRLVKTNTLSRDEWLEVRFTIQGLREELPSLDDPDGYTNMRSQKSAKSQIVARVVQGEQFFTYMQDGNWWQVRTAKGKVGYMHISRIRLLD